MSRSVSYPSGAIVAFREVDEDELEWFDETIADLRDWIQEVFPSFEPEDTWLGQEDHAIAANRFAYFGVSTYGSVMALWIVPREFSDYYSDERSMAPLASEWVTRAAPRFLSTFGTLRKLGTFSNGEAVYERVR